MSACPVRMKFAEGVLAEGERTAQRSVPDVPTLAPGTVRVVVRFGSSEHPQPASAVYLGPAEDRCFHWVRRLSGDLARVHEHQLDPEFRAVLRAAEPVERGMHVFPQGRWATKVVRRDAEQGTRDACAPQSPQ